VNRRRIHPEDEERRKAVPKQRLDKGGRPPSDEDPQVEDLQGGEAAKRAASQPKDD
jgi:hypothetical protein